MTEEEVLTEAIKISRAVVEGSMPAMEGAWAVWVMSSENGRALFDELRPFIAAASQWDEAVASRVELERDAYDAAVALLDRHPGAAR